MTVLLKNLSKEQNTLFEVFRKEAGLNTGQVEEIQEEEEEEGLYFHRFDAETQRRIKHYVQQRASGTPVVTYSIKEVFADVL
jgi:hypothetical protein